MIDETDQQRMERYLQMATETAAQAQRAGDPAVAEAYMHLAEVWLKLAGEMSGRFPANEEPVEAEESPHLQQRPGA